MQRQSRAVVGDGEMAGGEIVAMAKGTKTRVVELVRGGDLAALRIGGEDVRTLLSWIGVGGMEWAPNGPPGDGREAKNAWQPAQMEDGRRTRA